MRIDHGTPNCADFDIALSMDGPFAFRVLFPEHIEAAGASVPSPLHTIPGQWQHEASQVRGRYRAGTALEVDVRLVPGEGVVQVALGVRNSSAGPLRDLWADICASVNHLPKDAGPGWCNRHFVATEVPLDRAAQGRYWYEVLTPTRLWALTSAGWARMHPSPDHPQADAVPQYHQLRSESADAEACAVQSLDGELWFFQCWDALCRYRLPFPGNACMHLQPLLARDLAVGAAVVIRGLVGLHCGDRATLAERIQRFRRGQNEAR